MKPMIILSLAFIWAASVFSQGYTNIPRDGEGCMTDTIEDWQEHIINTGSPNVYFTSDVSQSFYLDENGVTIKCINCQPGDTGTVNGIRYEAVDKALLEQRRDEGADLTRLCTSLVTDMEHLFSRMTEFNQDIASWDVSNVTNMRALFNGAASFNQDIGAWDVKNVTRMDYLLHNALIFDQDIGAWDVSNVTRMNCMFSGDSLSLDQMKEEPVYTVFNQDIGNWDVSNVTIMFQMFSYNSSFNQDISDWDVSNVTDMEHLFTEMTGFNQDIASWDVSHVTNMRALLKGAASFNQDLSHWCVENITDEPLDFATDCPLSSDYYPLWGKCPCLPLIDFTATIYEDETYQWHEMELSVEGIYYDILSMESGCDTVYRLDLKVLQTSAGSVTTTPSQISIFPNPTNNFFTIEQKNPVKTELEIFNINRQLILSKIIELPAEQIDMTPYPRGIYFVTLKSDDWARTEKVVKY